MAVTLMEILASWSQLGVYSHITAPGDRMQRFFGMQVGGPAENRQRGRNFQYRFFDHTRQVAAFRAPGTGPSIVKNTPVGVVNGAFARTHEKKIMQYEELGNMRPLEMNAPLDPGGQQYITRQQRTLYQRFANAREVSVIGALRGSLGFLIQGEDMVPVLTGGDITMDFRIPPANKTQGTDPSATPLISATWANVGTDIIGDLARIEQCSEARTGRPIRHAWTDSKVWNNVLTNTAVRNAGGTAATPYASWDMVEEAGPDGHPIRYFTAVIKGYPHVQWHIYNSGLEINGTFTRFFDGTMCTFTPDPDPEYFQMGVGSEYVVENIGAEAVERVGFFPWGKTSDEPASIQLLALDNFCPQLYIPAAIYPLTVVY